jgi:hypothetical protein
MQDTNQMQQAEVAAKPLSRTKQRNLEIAARSAALRCPRFQNTCWTDG